MSQLPQGPAATPSRDSPAATQCDAAALVRHIAHELRQPLSAIESIAYYLEIVLPRTESKARLQVAKLQQQVQEINWILADALHFLQAATLHLQLLDLNEIIARSLAEWTRPSNLEVRLDLAGDLPSARLDAEQSQHLVRNLLFFLGLSAKCGEPISVSTTKTPEAVLLQVSSAVREFGPADLDSLFEPFRLQGSSGSGLALASARRIAEAHGARIEVQSEPADRLCLTVAFPATV